MWIFKSNSCHRIGAYDDPAATQRDVIDYVTIASTGNAVDFGNFLTAAYAHGKGICASPTRGINIGWSI